MALMWIFFQLYIMFVVYRLVWNYLVNSYIIFLNLLYYYYYTPVVVKPPYDSLNLLCIGETNPTHVTTHAFLPKRSPIKVQTTPDIV